MLSRDFCYWLQGYFELSSVDDLVLNDVKIETISNHLNMMFKHNNDSLKGDVPAKLHSWDFCNWLQGFIEGRDEGSFITSEQCSAIAEKLSLVFRHEIDSAMGDAEHQAELTALHKPTPRPPRRSTVIGPGSGQQIGPGTGPRYNDRDMRFKC